MEESIVVGGHRAELNLYRFPSFNTREGPCFHTALADEGSLPLPRDLCQPGSARCDTRLGEGSLSLPGDTSEQRNRTRYNIVNML